MPALVRIDEGGQDDESVVNGDLAGIGGMHDHDDPWGETLSARP